jgi:hypothetical protein
MSTNTLTAPPGAVVAKERRFFTKQVDAVRIERALREHDQRVADEKTALAAVAVARKAVEAAHERANAAAVAGANLTMLTEHEELVERAQRGVAVAERQAIGAASRRELGEQTRDHEMKQAHGGAMNAAFSRLLAIRDEANDVFGQLERLKFEHRKTVAEFRQLANSAGSGLPSYVSGPASDELVRGDGKMMDDAEFANRLAQPAHHEWDVAAGKLRWVED